jgi:hypothetical protein
MTKEADVNVEITIVIVSTAITLVALLASGSALYVTMKIKHDMLEFERQLMKDLDARFLRVEEYRLTQASDAREESIYRDRSHEKIEGIEVEVKRIGDDILVQLKGINKILDRSPEPKAKR